MGMGFAPTWLRQLSPLLHKTTLTTDYIDYVFQTSGQELFVNDCFLIHCIHIHMHVTYGTLLYVYSLVSVIFDFMLI